MVLFEPVPSEPAHLLILPLKYMLTYILAYIHEILLLQNPFLVPDVDHGPRGLRRVLCMQAAGSVDHPLPPQSDAGGWGRVTCGQAGSLMGGAGSFVGGAESLVGGAGSLLGGQGHWWVGQGHWWGGAVTTTV